MAMMWYVMETNNRYNFLSAWIPIFLQSWRKDTGAVSLNKGRFMIFKIVISDKTAPPPRKRPVRRPQKVTSYWRYQPNAGKKS